MWTKINKYKEDLEKLIKEWDNLLYAMYYETDSEWFKEAFKKVSTDKDIEKMIKKLPNFKSNYQTWYSESLILLKYLLPDRLNDFIKLYEKPKNRKVVSYDNYSIEDYLQWFYTSNSYTWEIKVWTHWAIPNFQQQLNIIKSIKKRFESSLFDIKQLLQADLFDNELESARELNKKWFIRWAWAIAWVVLEEHFQNVCDSHNIKVSKKNPWINDFNDLLKSNSIIEIDMFRFIQRLWDLRNKCDHKKTVEPTKEDIEELINWVDRVIKTVF